jgi:hypothetical protein
MVFTTDKHYCKRQATLHDCLPILLGDGDKLIEIVYGGKKHILYWVRLEHPSQNKNLLYRHEEPNQPICTL